MGDWGTLGQQRKAQPDKRKGYGNIRTEYKVKPAEGRPKAMPPPVEWLDTPPAEEPRRNLRKLDLLLEKVPLVKCKFCDFVVPQRWTSSGEETSSLLSHMTRCNPELAAKIRADRKRDHFRGLGL